MWKRAVNKDVSGPKWLSIISIVLAFAATFIGGTVMTGWFTGHLILAQISPQFVLMPFNPALCIFLSGIAILLLNRFPKITFLLALIIGVIGGLTLFEWAFFVNLGIDNLFFKYQGPNIVTNIGRMAPNASINCSLIALALLCLSLKNINSKFLTTIQYISSILVAALGLFTLIGYLFPSTAPNHYVTQMALMAALGFTFLGVSLYIQCWLAHPINTHDTNLVISSLIFIAGALIFNVLWLKMISETNIAIREKLSTEAQFIIHDVHEEINWRLVSMKRFFHRESEANNETLLTIDVEDYFDSLPNLLAIQITQKNKLFINPSIDNSIGVELLQKCALFKKEKMGIFDNQSHYYLCFNINNNFSVFDFSPIMDPAISKLFTKEKGFIINSNGNILYKHIPREKPMHIQQWQVIVPFLENFSNKPIYLTQWPTDAYIRDNSSSLPVTFVSSSLIITALLATIIYLAQLIANANRSLESELQIKHEAEESLSKKVIELNLIYHIPTIFTDADTFGDAINSSIQLICTSIGWTIGHGFLTNKAEIGNFPHHFWYSTPTEPKKYVRRLENELSEGKKTFFAENVVDIKKPFWIRNRKKEAYLFQRPLFRHLKIKSIIGFPIIYKNDAIAIIEFFSRKEEEKDLELLRIFKILGEQLGLVIERKFAEKKLFELANYDSLTGLPNRNYFYDLIKRKVADAEKSHKKFSLIFIDIDHFKDINDTLGHDVGDQLLLATAKILKRTLRPEDTIARLGGDEFVVVVDQFPAQRDCNALCQRLIKLFDTPIPIKNHTIKITVSMGVATYPTTSVQPDTLLKQADTAMYEAKASGRNTFRYFTDHLNVSYVRKIDIEQQLHHAIQEHEFYLVYQPIFNIHTNAIVGSESLLRWHNKKLGDIPPYEFIEIAENRDLIYPIGKWVLENACLQFSQWEKLWPHLLIYNSINCSVLQIQKDEFSEDLKDILKKSKISPNKIILEITESALMHEAKTSETIINKLIAQKVRLAIDDFGTGYSSLNYLKMLPLSFLKIDKSFIDDLEKVEADKSITQSIIALSRILGISTIAEGVETEGELKILRELGCEYAQGYYFSRPLRKEEFEQFILKNVAKL